jgi:hypothetical protein
MKAVEKVHIECRKTLEGLRNLCESIDDTSEETEHFTRGLGTSRFLHSKLRKKLGDV